MLNIIFEDPNILVINKPSGLVVNNSDTSGDVTVQNLVSSSIDEIPDDSEENSDTSEFALRGGIVHRLDKDTSGVLLIAKNEKVFKILQSQFKQRTVTKEYTALVHGKIEDKIFEVNAPIGRNPKNRLKFAVVLKGKEAITAFESIKHVDVDGEVLTLVKAFPKTGRTHQIRVHLAAMGFPVVGDTLYSTSNQYGRWKDRFPRLMLHAEKLTITHPISGGKVTFEASLPHEFMI